MERRVRLRRRTDFHRTMEAGRLYQGRALIVFAVPGPGPDHRVGITVSRGIRSAVDRNRARRRLREVTRLGLLAADSPLARRGIRYDVVLVARPAVLAVSFADLQAEASEAAVRISSRPGR